MKIYVIKADAKSGPLYKIGITNNHTRRLATLATGCPFPTSVIGIFTHDDPRVLERDIHRALQKHRLSGEWFECSLKDILSAGKEYGAIYEKVMERRIRARDFSDSFGGGLDFHSTRLRMSQVQIANVLEVSSRTVFSWMASQSEPNAITQEGAIARLEKL